MAYKPANDIKENIIHRNTIFGSQGMVSCCTCEYCIKKTEDATVSLFNFKAAEPIINENSIGSTILEFSDYMIPTGTFTYALTPSPIPQNKNPTGLADSLTYYPFLNCNGETTERAIYTFFNWYYPYNYSYWKVPSYYNEKTAFPYGIAVVNGTTHLSPEVAFFTPLNTFDLKTSTQQINFFSYATFLQKNIYENGYDSGSYDNYLSYISNHDFSVEGANPDAECSNNILKIMNPVFFLDVSGYSFSYLYPNYSIDSSTKNIYTSANSSGVVCSGYKDSYNWSYNTETHSNRPIFKEGYVLNKFSIDKTGLLSSKISVINTNRIDYSLYSQVGDQKVIEKVSSLGTIPAYSSAMSSIFYENQQLKSYFKNGSFQDIVPFIDHRYYDYTIDNVYCGNPAAEVFFGIFRDDVYWQSTPPVIRGYYEYPTDPTLPINYTASKTNRTQMLTSTDSTGKTTLTIKNVLWTGKTLLTNTYKHDSGANRPNLSTGKVPLNYQAILKGGFESDIEVKFQSVPYCQLINLPDKLKRVTEIKVKFENYEKIPQSNMINYDMALRYFQDTPLIGDPFYSLAAFNGTMVGIAFSNDPYNTDNFNSFNYNYQYYGYKEFENIAFLPPNVNASNEFFVRKGTQSQGFYFTSIKKDMVAIDPPVLTSYVAKSGRVYPDFGVPDRFKSCLLINGDASVWQTGNEVKFVGFDYKVTNGGTGYTSVPTVTLSDGGGTGATAYANISDGKVISVTTGSKGINYTSNKTVVISGGGGSGATALDVNFTPFYSIYMEEIKDEKQTAGQSLIRIATTLDNANAGIYIPNAGLDSKYSGKPLSVKFLYGYKDLSIENLPRYTNVNTNNIDITNINADILGASYSSSIGYPTSFNSKFDFSFSTSGSSGFAYEGRRLVIKFSMPETFPNMPIYLENFVFEGSNWYTPDINQNFEIISLSPLKIKYPKMKFDNYHNTDAIFYYSTFNFNFPRTNINVTFPWSSVESHLTGALFFGFQCDVIIEEVVDEFIEEALPVEFNQILENVEYIQTANAFNARIPMQMIDPEKCEHIGKVIDRKNCNCPKKWVRLCDVHGKTDYKQCMQCKDFKVSE